jgi:WD40 repeat protein
MHVPHHSNISSMHLMSESGLLTSSLFYGIVSRSVPLTGKIHKGFIDAAGTGLGIGNPNVEFSPDVTACAITSEGATARVLWGFRSGAVAVTTAPRAVHNSRPTSRLVRCTVSEQHNAQVSDVVWTPDQALCVTGAADGTVKLWDAKEVRCFWTSPKHEGPEVPSPYVKVAINVSSGVVAGAKANGEITAWAVDFSKGVPSVGRNVSIPSPQEGSKVVPTTLSIDTSDAKPVLLITFTDDRYLYRVNLDFSTGTFQRAAFGEESSGAIRSVYAAFAKKEGESSFVVSGDQMGFMRIFDWRTGSIISRIEVNEDGTPVTALALNECVLVSGSELGVTRVWDALTLAHLRHIQPITTTARFSPNIGQGVSNIVLERDMVVASVGARVMSWKAGPVSSHIGKPLVKGQKSAKRIGGAKGYGGSGSRSVETYI